MLQPELSGSARLDTGQPHSEESLIQETCMCVCVCVCVWNSLSCIWLLRPHGLYSPWNSPGQNTRVGSLSILQGIFPNQGLNPGLPHCRRILYQLSHKGSPRILEWVTYPFSRGSSLPKELNRGLLHCREFFTSWATREECVCVCVYVCVCVCMCVCVCVCVCACVHIHTVQNSVFTSPIKTGF